MTASCTATSANAVPVARTLTTRTPTSPASAHPSGMARWMVVALRTPGLSSTEKVLLLVIATHAWNDTAATVSIGRLVSYSGLGRRWVTRALRRLEGRGLLATTRRQRPGSREPAASSRKVVLAGIWTLALPDGADDPRAVKEVGACKPLPRGLGLHEVGACKPPEVVKPLGNKRREVGDAPPGVLARSPDGGSRPAAAEARTASTPTPAGNVVASALAEAFPVGSGSPAPMPATDHLAGFDLVREALGLPPRDASRPKPWKVEQVSDLAAMGDTLALETLNVWERRGWLAEAEVTA